jgi:type VI secretion system FHA domain protein
MPAAPVTPAPQALPPIADAPIMPPQPARAPLGAALANDLVALRPSGASMPLPGERVLDPLAVLKERAAQRPASAPEPRNAAPLPAAFPPADLSGNADEMQEFWNALGLDPNVVPPEKRRDVLAEIGRAVAEMANGLHSVLAARAMVKNEFHIEQTRIRSGDNNAFKFMKSGQDALRKSLVRDHGFLPLARSVREGFHDIKAHEVAAMMAMRAAVSNVLTRMSPQRLETDGATSGLFGGRVDKSKLWDRFVEMHTSMVNDIDKTTRAYIAEEFSRSYESQVSALKQGEGTTT